MLAIKQSRFLKYPACRRITSNDGDIKRYNSSLISRKDVLDWNEKYNAFNSINKDSEFVFESTQGSLKGLAIAVKDNICTKGFKTTCSSKTLKDFDSGYDATVIKLLKQNGAVIVGKTNLDEFGMGSFNQNSAFGPVINPHPSFGQHDHVTGGSSGGSAAAVAGKVCFGALGSDTGGSVRLPASYCGIVGFKPSYGRISRFGLIPYASSLDTIGILARDVPSVELIFNATQASDPLDSTSDQFLEENMNFDEKGLTIGIPQEYFLEEMEPSVMEAWRGAIRKLKELGYKVVPVSLPSVPHSLSAYYIIALGEASSNLSKYDGVEYGHRIESSTFSDMVSLSRSSGFGLETQRRIILGTYVLSSSAIDAYFFQAQRVRRLVKEDFDLVFDKTNKKSKGVDILLTPTSQSSAPSVQHLSSQSPASSYLNDALTIPASLAGVPAISLPWHPTDNSSPIGLQLISKFGSDSFLLSVASKLSNAFKE